MITINTVSDKYFTLDGIQFAAIYQPLKQGLEDVGIYSIYDTRKQLLNSTNFAEFTVDGSTYASQSLLIAALLDVIWSSVSESDVEDLQDRVDNLEENQYSGVVVYSTLAELPATGTLLVSYKVSNDPNTALNGYYHWSGAVYVKDASLTIGAIMEGNVDAVSGGTVYDWGVEKNIDLINDTYTQGKNLYNFATRNLGTFLSGSGTLNVNAGNDTSDYIPVNELTDYVVKFSARVSVYDASKVFIINIVTDQFATPASAAFIRFSGALAEMDEAALNQFEEGSATTSFEPFGHYAKAESISDFDESVVLAVEADGFIKPVVGKNLYNKDAKTEGFYINQNDGTLIANEDFAYSEYMAIEESTDYVVNYNSFYAFYDEGKVYISGGTNGLSLTSPGNAKFIRISSSIVFMGSIDIFKNQFEQGTANTEFEYFKDAFNSENVRTTTEPTIVTAALSGVADFTGRRAIQDAIDSVLDASPDNPYEIQVAKGVYTATQVSEFDKDNYQNCFIEGKDNVGIVGTSKEEVIIIGSLPDDLGTGFAYEDYQPVYLGMYNSILRGVTVIARNCRYPIHIDKPNSFVDSVSEIKDCVIRHDGNTGDALVRWQSFNPIGIGTASGQVLTVKCCDIASISTHDNLNYNEPAIVRYNDCNITGRGDELGNIIAQASSLGGGKPSKLIAEDCNVSGNGRALINTANSSTELTDQIADRISVELIMKTTKPLPVDNANVNGWGLRINSISTGASSTVRFNEASTAFEFIISTDLHSVEYENRYLRSVLDGYQYSDGGNGLSGYAIGSLNIGEDSSITSLGKRLGDCSVTSKTLTVIIDGVTYNVVFNTNLTNETNATVIALIDAIISSVATIEEYIVALDYYPEFKGNTLKTNDDTAEILQGMGIVFTGFNTMRKALNADSRIDGICLDDCIVGGKARIITIGQIYTDNTSQRFRIKEIAQATRNAGDEFGISATAGVFDITASPKLIKCVFENVVEI